MLMLPFYSNISIAKLNVIPACECAEEKIEWNAALNAKGLEMTAIVASLTIYPPSQTQTTYICISSYPTYEYCRSFHFFLLYLFIGKQSSIYKWIKFALHRDRTNQHLQILIVRWIADCTNKLVIACVYVHMWIQVNLDDHFIVIC